MTYLVCFVEDKSSKLMLESILPKLLPKNITFKVISFEGKQDLEKHIEKKLKYWQLNNSAFLIMRDQDSGSCITIKKDLLRKVKSSGKEKLSIIRIACHELESFYLGDLKAVSMGLGIKDLANKQTRSKFRNPDYLTNAKQELIKITNGSYQPVKGSRSISSNLSLDGSNCSKSFNMLLNGIEFLSKLNCQNNSKI